MVSVETCALGPALYTRGAEVTMRALVTGAASGIGRATCLRLARDARAQGKKAQIAAVDLGPSAGLDGLLDELGKLEADTPTRPLRPSATRSSPWAASLRPRTWPT